MYHDVLLFAFYLHVTNILTDTVEYCQEAFLCCGHFAQQTTDTNVLTKLLALPLLKSSKTTFIKSIKDSKKRKKK